jgi:uncharacterized protein YlxP (DUF503 family)
MPLKIYDLDSLKNKRTSARRAFTKTANSVKDIVAETDATRVEVTQVKAAVVIMKEAIVELKELDSAIEMKLLLADVTAAEEDADKSSDLLITNQLKITTAEDFVMESSKAKAVPLKATTFMDSKSKLPKLTLPKFDGNCKMQVVIMSV